MFAIAVVFKLLHYCSKLISKYAHISRSPANIGDAAANTLLQMVHIMVVMIIVAMWQQHD